MEQPPNQPWQQPNTQYPPQQFQQPYQQWQPPMMPPPPPPPKKPDHSKRNAWLIIAVIIAAVVVFAAGYNGTSEQSTSTVGATPTTDTILATDTPTDTPVPTFGVTPVPTSTPAPLPKWTTTHTFSGTGDKKTEVFSVPSDWKILWSCTDNTGYNIGGVFYVEVYNSDNTDFDISAVSAQCSPGKTTRDSTEEHQSGDVYLEIIDGLPWTVQVQELK